MVYNFGRVSVCSMTTFKRLDVESSFSLIQYISTDYESNSHMTAIGSRSRSQEHKT